MLEEQIIDAAILAIEKSSLATGGFAPYPGGSFRPDATAWAVLALDNVGYKGNLLRTACQRLAAGQIADGRLPVVKDRPETFWPTSLALLAWKKVSGFEKEAGMARRFLLASTGLHWRNQNDNVFAHDASIKGWPWMENTHSWIEPTSLTVVAIRASGDAVHERVLEAVRMILDRQLASGGWNYGNTRVFGAHLPPIPECTGHALSALAGLVNPNEIKLSLDYMRREAERLRTPLALSWAIFGLAGWSIKPNETQQWILESLSLQEKYGDYDTTLLSQLLIAYFTQGDLLSSFR